mmetsp:Transcript_9554/g.10891  ORF Transcript_9554/g.10891 Transcript_9554/m.10891 type:complete len:125 (-) Transcript_9554:622-996(-)
MGFDGPIGLVTWMLQLASVAHRLQHSQEGIIAEDAETYFAMLALEKGLEYFDVTYIESQEYARNVFRSHILKTKLMNIMPRFYGMEDFCRNKVYYACVAYLRIYRLIIGIFAIDLLTSLKTQYQ